MRDGHLADSGLPPVHDREPDRVQLSIRLLISLDRRLRRFAKANRTTIQATVEVALNEYLRRHDA